MGALLLRHDTTDGTTDSRFLVPSEFVQLPIEEKLKKPSLRLQDHFSGERLEGLQRIKRDAFKADPNAPLLFDFRTIVSRNIWWYASYLNYKPTWQQAQALDAIHLKHKQIAIRSGQGPGKTRVSTCIGTFRAFAYPFGRTIVTAPTMAQCKDIWLGELKRVMREADNRISSMFDVTETRVGVLDQKAKDWGILLNTSTRPENAQGQHEDNLAVIVEEASGVDAKVIEQYMGTLKNANSLLFLIGNPNSRDCEFFKAFYSPKSEFYKLHWNAEETPKSKWYDPAANDKLARIFGRDSDVYRVRVLGEFPNKDAECLFSTEELEAVSRPEDKFKCMSTPNPSGRIARNVSFDFARFGGDENVVMYRMGTAVMAIEIYPREEPAHVIKSSVYKVLNHLKWTNNILFIPDCAGMGQGLVHLFYDDPALKGKCEVHEYQSHQKASTNIFDNKATEAWFHLKLLVRDKKIWIPEDPILWEQLTTRRYGRNEKNGKFRIEPKDDYKTRTGNGSPDRADALVQLFYDEIDVSEII